MFFFVPALLGRNICNIGFFERPLCIGLLWSLVTGDYAFALPLSIFFELLWLDLFPIGGYIPPMGAFPFLLLLSLAPQYAWTEPARLAFPLLISLPLAFIVPFAEARLRRRHKEASSILVQRVKGEAGNKQGEPAAELVSRAAAYSVFWGIGLFAGTYYLIRLLLQLPYLNTQPQVSVPYATWPVFFIIAAIGALLSLRIRPAYLVFSCCMAGALLLLFL